VNNQINHYSLLDADDSILIVIDVQDAFLGKLPTDVSQRLLNNVCWLISLAQWLQIPLIVTAEEFDQQPLASQLVDSLPPDMAVFNKVIFGLAQQPDILAAVEKTKRRTAVLIGLETDVCITHSAIGLLEKSYRVAVVTDATGTPVPGQEVGLNRMQNAGVLLVNMKSIFYEWLRSVENVNRFHRELPHMRGLAGTTL